MRKFRVVFFDLDGTLIDSEPIWSASITDVLAGYGMVLTPELEARCAGLTNEEGIQLVLDEHPEVTVDIAEVSAKITDTVEVRLREQSQAMEGADELLAELQRREVPMALVSASPLRLINNALEGHKWRGYFKIITSVEEVGPGKPNPAVYVEALRRMEASPAEVLVLEDTLAGTQSAKGAGLYTIAMPSYELERGAIEREADKVFGSLKEAGEWTLERVSDD